MPVAPDIESDTALWEQLENDLTPPCALNSQQPACWITWFKDCHYCDAHKEPDCQGHFLCDMHLESLLTGTLTCAHCNKTLKPGRIERLR